MATNTNLMMRVSIVTRVINQEDAHWRVGANEVTEWHWDGSWFIVSVFCCVCGPEKDVPVLTYIITLSLQKLCVYNHMANRAINTTRLKIFLCGWKHGENVESYNLNEMIRSPRLIMTKITMFGTIKSHWSHWQKTRACLHSQRFAVWN